MIYVSVSCTLSAVMTADRVQGERKIIGIKVPRGKPTGYLLELALLALSHRKR